MKQTVTALLLLLSSASLSLPQAKDTVTAPGPAGEFPVQLLEGMEDFAVVLQFYADSRGNFGPCG